MTYTLTIKASQSSSNERLAKNRNTEPDTLNQQAKRKIRNQNMSSISWLRIF